MKAATIVAILALASVVTCARHLSELTVLDPALEEAFGAETYAYLLTLPQEEANKRVGKIVNGTQTVRTNNHHDTCGTTIGASGGGGGVLCWSPWQQVQQRLQITAKMPRGFGWLLVLDANLGGNRYTCYPA